MPSGGVQRGNRARSCLHQLGAQIVAVGIVVDIIKARVNTVANTVVVVII